MSLVNPRLYSLFEVDSSHVDDQLRMRRGAGKNKHWVRIGVRAFPLEEARLHYYVKLNLNPDTTSLRVVNGKRVRGSEG